MMALLSWFAGEEIEFINRLSGVVSQNGAGTFRPTYTRGSLALPHSGPRGTTPQADSIPLAVPVTSMWLRCFYFQSGTSNPCPQFGFGRTSQVLGGIMVGESTADSHKVALFKVDNTGAYTEVAAETGTSIAPNILYQYDIQITNFNNAATNVKVYLTGNNLPIINWTGSTIGLGFTNLDCARFISNGSGGTGAVSEGILADEDTRPLVACNTLFPNAPGIVNTWAGAYTDINELVLDPASMITAGANGLEFECNMSNLAAGNWSIRGVKLTVQAACGAAGPQTLDLGIDSGGTDDTVPVALTVNLQSYERLMLVNPVTTNPWSISEVNAVQADLVSAA